MKKNRLFILAFTWLLPVVVWTQDSLGIRALLETAQNIPQNEAAYQKYLMAYSESRQIQYDEGLRLALPKLAAWELKSQNTAGALRYLLEELALLENLAYPTRRIAVANQIGDIYYREHLYTEALRYYQIVNQGIAIQDKEQKGLILQKVGDTFAELLEPDSAFQYYAQLPIWAESRKKDLMDN